MSWGNISNTIRLVKCSGQGKKVTLQHVTSDGSRSMPQPQLMWCSCRAGWGSSEGFSSCKVTGGSSQRVVLSSAAWKGSFANVKAQRRKVALSPTDSYPKQQNPAGLAQCSITFCDCEKTCPQHHGLDKWDPLRAVPGQHHTQTHHSRDRECTVSNS